MKQRFHKRVLHKDRPDHIQPLHRDEPNPQWDVLSDRLGSERDPVVTDKHVLVTSSGFAGHAEHGRQIVSFIPAYAK
jgi:hypothetical protein